MLATCPHCRKEIDLLEPKDLDEMGLTPNVRGPLIKSGSLPVWATLRGGKFFLFLRENVKKAQLTKQLEKADKLAKSASTSEDEYRRVFSAIEKALKESDGLEPPPTPRQPRRRKS